MDHFEQFYNDLKFTEKRDSNLTSEQQIDRLLRPGSSYLNLNPFEVLQLDPDTNIEEAKKKYKKLSLLIHPDKNPDNRERAERAFDSLKKAIATLEDPDEMARCREMYEEAKARLAVQISEKRRKNKRVCSYQKLAIYNIILKLVMLGREAGYSRRGYAQWICSCTLGNGNKG